MPKKLSPRQILANEQDGLSEAYCEWQDQQARLTGADQQPGYERYSHREALSALVWMATRTPEEFLALLPTLRAWVDKDQLENPARWLDVEVVSN